MTDFSIIGTAGSFQDLLMCYCGSSDEDLMKLHETAKQRPQTSISSSLLAGILRHVTF
jgi:hypothetical protein